MVFFGASGVSRSCEGSEGVAGTGGIDFFPSIAYCKLLVVAVLEINEESA
jgi:hypothetical protein